MAQHLQMRGVQANLRSRGIALRMREGKFYVRDTRAHNSRDIRCDDLDDAYFMGLQIAAKREQSYRVAA